MSLKFYITDLIISGLDKKDASLKFDTGLNVISGASDTGKSFVFNCIDFMMGAANPPVFIDEMNGYDTCYLVIKTKEGLIYTIKRSIVNSSSFFIKEGGYAADNLYERYAPKLSDDPNNISSFFLRLIGLDKDIKLKKNKRNSTNRLSFRDIAGLFMVNEENVISKTSPVFNSGISLAETKEISLFNLLLTGVDGSALIEIEDNKIRKSKIDAQIELIEGLIKRKEVALEDFEDIKDTNLDEELKLKYETLNLDYVSTIEQIDIHRNRRSEFYDERVSEESKLLFNRELLDRFELLKEHYKSDINRLDFIVEGSHLFDQLHEVNCPICGSTMTEGTHDHKWEISKPSDKFEIAMHAELEKLRIKQTDLHSTIEKINKENAKISKNIIDLDKRIALEDKVLHASLVPVSESLRDRLNEISILNKKFNEFKLIERDINQLNTKIQELIVRKNTKPSVNTEDSTDYSKNYIDFSDVLKDILISWSFEDVRSVIFDTDSQVYDVVINGKLRGSRGKGYRALTYTAFLYALLKYNINKLDTHPGILIVDSPLTTFKDKDSAFDESDNADVPIGIEHSFFKSFIDDGEQMQVIIFENKEPAEDLKNKMNYIHFSKEKTLGRYGFFEPLQSI
ncbi:hypothetical protein ACK8HY_06305 [Sphingobacterium sp. NGMCC 1.201703]|uniref:hypothetical protein n=1 Tax=Sphingobacterium sp. NGMCC 1.201703 TaxID=3388657 RepID=UPI0039FD2402